MKILSFGDVHCRQEAPRWRTDNYSDTHFKKMEWCFNLAQREECPVVAMPGDIFHSPRASDDTKRKFQALLRKYENITTLGIFGQHDVHHYRSDLDNTPLGVVESSGLMYVLRDPYIGGEADFYGASWNEPIPEIVDSNKINILLIHKMIIKEDELYPGQENYITARTILAKNKFDLIISGDNHGCFTSEYNGRTLLNMGSLCRMTTAQLNHKPTVAIYDTDTKTYELFEVPIAPSHEVFNLEEVKKIKDHKEIDTSIKEYVDILNGNDSETKELNFVSNLDRFITKNNVRESVASIIKSTLEC